MHTFSPSDPFALLLCARDRVRHRSMHERSEERYLKSKENSLQKVLFVSPKNKDSKRNVRLSGGPSVVNDLDELSRSSKVIYCSSIFFFCAGVQVFMKA